MGHDGLTGMEKLKYPTCLAFIFIILKLIHFIKKYKLKVNFIFIIYIKTENIKYKNYKTIFFI